MTNTLCVDDVTFNLLEHMISFIKTEKMPDDLTIDETADLLSSAQRYEMDGLVFQCECNLMKRVTVDTVCKMYEISKKISNKTLRRWCIAFLRREVVSLKEKIADLSSTSLKEVLSLNRLNVPNESTVLEIVLLWARIRGLDTKHRDVCVLLDCVRWNFLTEGEMNKFDPDDLSFYQSLADESKSLRDNTSLKSWSSPSLSDYASSGKENTDTYSPVSRTKAQNGSPSSGKERKRSYRRRSKGNSDSDDYNDETVYLDREVFKRINASGRRKGTTKEIESMYLQLYRNNYLRWPGFGDFRPIRKRSSCTSQDRLFLYTSGDKDWPRTRFNDILRGIASMDDTDNRDFTIELPPSVDKNFVPLKYPVIVCLTFTINVRVQLHKIVLELKADSEIEITSLTGYELRVRRKTPNLHNTYGTVGKMKLGISGLVGVILRGCNRYDIECEMPRPIAMSAETQYRVELSVGDQVFRWKQSALTKGDLRRMNYQDLVTLQEQTALAVKSLSFSVYD